MNPHIATEPFEFSEATFFPHSQYASLQPERQDRRIKRSMERLALMVRAEEDVHKILVAQSLAQAELAREERLAFGDPLHLMVNEPWKHDYWSGFVKLALGRAAHKAGQASAPRLNARERSVFKALGEDSGMGAETVTSALAPELYDSLHRTGAWRILGVVEIPTQGPNLKFAVLTARPNGQFVLTESGALADDASSTGVQPSGNVEVIAARLLVSQLLIADGVVLVPQFLEHFRDSVNARLEFAAWSGTGASDGDSGAMTGITAHADTVVVNAAAGHVSLAQCDRDDLVNLIDGCDSAALQRRPAFSCHPELLPALMKIKDAGGNPCLTVDPDIPGETIYRLLGFNLYLTSGAPSVNVAQSKVLVFGDHRAVGVGIRREFGLQASTGARFANLQADLRGWMRARVEIRKGTMLSVLKLAA